MNFICNEAHDAEKQKKILRILNDSKEFNYFNNNTLKNDYKIILNKITSNEFNSQKTNTLFFNNLIYLIDFDFAKTIFDLMKNDIIEKNDFFSTQVEKYLLEDKLKINTDNIKQSIIKNKI